MKKNYCFKCPDGHRTTRMMEYEETKNVFNCPKCGKPMNRDYKAEHSTESSGDHGCWPMVSEAAAVHPSQIAEAKDLIRRKGGVDCEFDKHGRPIFTSMGHRRRCLRAMGYEDKKGYY